MTRRRLIDLVLVLFAVTLLVLVCQKADAQTGHGATHEAGAPDAIPNMLTGSGTPGVCVEWGAGGSLVDSVSGQACGAASGGVTNPMTEDLDGGGFAIVNVKGGFQSGPDRPGTANADVYCDEAAEKSALYQWEYNAGARAATFQCRDPANPGVERWTCLTCEHQAIDLELDSWVPGDCLVFDGTANSASCASRGTELPYAFDGGILSVSVVHRASIDVPAGESCRIDLLVKNPTEGWDVAGTLVGPGIIYGDASSDETGETVRVEYDAAYDKGGAIQVQLSNNATESCNGVRGTLSIEISR